MTATHIPRRLALLVATLLVAAACSGNTATLAQTDARVLDLMRQVTAIVGGDPEEVMRTTSQVRMCESQLPRSVTGQQGISRSLEINGLTVTDVGARAAAVRRYAEQQGFRVSVASPTAGGGERSSYVDDDGYLLAVGISADGASVGANSPCVWPNGTPP